MVSNRIQSASETRGFAVTRLLTHWAEVAGPDIASISRPVDISYGRSFGATLTLLTTGANAPMLEMQKDKVIERVNACYGYAAIRKVRITQTAATGFSEGRAIFEPAAKSNAAPTPIAKQAVEATIGVDNSELRQALERLGSNVLLKSK
ncbi:DciA family protein [Rhodobacteraceae bacterium]|nr:DciA family protein [Paracoccaceae bacterium]